MYIFYGRCVLLLIYPRRLSSSLCMNDRKRMICLHLLLWIVRGYVKLFLLIRIFMEKLGTNSQDFIDLNSYSKQRQFSISERQLYENWAWKIWKTLFLYKRPDTCKTSGTIIHEHVEWKERSNKFMGVEMHCTNCHFK